MGELAERLRRVEVDPTPALRGHVTRVGDTVARVAGLGPVRNEELIGFDDGTLGMALELSGAHTGVVLLTEPGGVRAGDGARRLGRFPSVPVGDDLLGRIVDPLGRPLDGRHPPHGPRQPSWAPAPTLLERAPVQQPLFTGITAIDAGIPIGRGQRELIVGDHNTGKTALALDIVAAQRETSVLCVYVVVGSPMSRVLAIHQGLIASGASRSAVVVAAEAHATAGLQVLAPQAGMAIAEGFRAAGRDVLVVFDDLTKHADAWRELSLLLDRPPGREAFPGDVFYLHAHLLERAAPLKAGGSITALPIVETTDGDLSSYIPTNLISITDGQLVLDTQRFDRNERPAIDMGRSVSRIGGAAQTPRMRAAARDLRIVLSRADALEALTRVGLEVDNQTARVLRRGRVLRELLRQERLSARSVPEQILMLVGVRGGAMDEADPEQARRVFDATFARWRSRHAADHAALVSGAEPDPGWEDRWIAAVREFGA